MVATRSEMLRWKITRLSALSWPLTRISYDRNRRLSSMRRSRPPISTPPAPS